MWLRHENSHSVLPLFVSASGPTHESSNPPISRRYPPRLAETVIPHQISCVPICRSPWMSEYPATHLPPSSNPSFPSVPTPEFPESAIDLSDISVLGLSVRPNTPSPLSQYELLTLLVYDRVPSPATSSTTAEVGVSPSTSLSGVSLVRPSLSVSASRSFESRCLRSPCPLVSNKYYTAVQKCLSCSSHESSWTGLFGISMAEASNNAHSSHGVGEERCGPSGFLPSSSAPFDCSLSRIPNHTT